MQDGDTHFTYLFFVLAGGLRGIKTRGFLSKKIFILRSKQSSHSVLVDRLTRIKDGGKMGRGKGIW